MKGDYTVLAMLGGFLVTASCYRMWLDASGAERLQYTFQTLLVASLAWLFCWEFFSQSQKDRRKKEQIFFELPAHLRTPSQSSVALGLDVELGSPIFLPDSIRTRHVHILGATGSGKTESVILNFLGQDLTRGLGSVILDAKGDASFLNYLQAIAEGRLQVFDLGGENSLSYNPLETGTPAEASQRLFASLQWSEPYYRSKALSALQRIFYGHFEIHEENPTLSQLSDYLESPSDYSGIARSDVYPVKEAEKDYSDLGGLRDQLRILNTGPLQKTLSPKKGEGITLQHALDGGVIYFRLQSLLSPELVTIVGKLVINHLNFLAGVSHRSDSGTKPRKIIPIYLDEFASFASPEFADLISKARSAGFALHFSHQSIGDLSGVAEGFLNRITDNSGTKIILRVNDPDTAEYFSRSFGTRIYQKVTQRITNLKGNESGDALGEGSQREAHKYRASPDLLKTLPVGRAAVLIAHGYDTPQGASHVFTIQFPKLKEVRNEKHSPSDINDGEPTVLRDHG